MVALGPRVGGAHVNVNLKFDDKSLDAVGKRIHQQLASIGQHNREVYRSIGRESVTAWRAALGATVASAPLIGSLVSGLAGTATVAAGALYSLGQTSFAALPLLTSFGVAGLTASIGLRNFSAAVSETNPKALKELLEGMPKSMQDAVLASRDLSNEMRAAIWPKLFEGVGERLQRLGDTGIIQRGLGQMAESLNGLVTSVLDYANTKDGISTIDKFLQNNAKVFAALSKAAVPFLDGFLRLVNALTPAALRLADRITDLGERFQSWTKAEGFGKRINDMMKRAEKTAGLLWTVLGNLYTAFINIFNATNPATNTFLEMLVGITDRFKEFTGSVDGQKSIADWAMSSVDVMRQFGKTIEAVFKVIAELADPRVIINFLETVQKAFEYLGELPLDKFVDKFVQIAEAIQPISAAFLAVIIGGAALNILLGSLMGQLGGVVGVLASFKGIRNIFKGIFGGKGGGLGKHADDIGRFTGLLKGLGTILGKTLRFAGIAGLAVYITTLVVESDKLKGKVKEAFQAFKDLAEPLKIAFSEIKTSLTPVGKALKPVFGFLDKIARIGIGLVLDTIIYAFESLGNVIKGAGRIISGVIDFFVGLFSLDGSKMLDGLKKIGSGIVPLLKGIFGLFVSFFAPAKLLRIGGLALKGLGSGIAKAVPGILRFLGGFIVKILKFFVSLTPRLLALGGRAIVGLGKAVARNAPKVLAAAGRIVKGVIGWIARLPGRLLGLGKSAVGKLGGAVQSGTPLLLKLASRIFSGIVGFIAKLPGRLFKLGKWAFQRLGEAIRSVIGKVMSAAGAIFKAIWNEIKSLPGDMLKLGGSIIGGLVDGILGKLDSLKDAAGKVGKAIKDFLPGSPVKEGPLTAWNYGGDASGGGRNVIDAITGGLSDTDPIRKAMAGVADAVATSLIPRVNTGAAETRKTRTETGRTEPNNAGGNIYISKMMPHNYGEFEKQTREKSRLASLGGRPA